MQENITVEESRQISENYNILNITNLNKSSSINYYDKINKLFNLKEFDKIQLKDKYILVFYKESKSQDYYFKIDLRYNIIIYID